LDLAHKVSAIFLCCIQGWHGRGRLHVPAFANDGVRERCFASTPSCKQFVRVY
jgi:hypothetical protein